MTKRRMTIAALIFAAVLASSASAVPMAHAQATGTSGPAANTSGNPPAAGSNPQQSQSPAPAPTPTASSNSSVGGGVSNTLLNVAKLWNLSLGDLVAALLAWIMNWAIMAMGLVLAMTGWLLNFSINLTLHIRDFVDSSPAVFNTWRAIRDISGLFIIFFLLYAAIQLILGLEDPKFNTLIRNIVMAGILINFSFFFAGLGIDASNIVSVQLYNAIAPAQTLNPDAVSKNLFSTVNTTNGVTSVLGDGGLSDIFMTSLRIPSLYDPKTGGLSQAAATLNNGGSTGISAIFTVFFDEVAAFMIELVAAISFAVAAFAFIIRFIVLIVLLAFSPIWFVSFISPQIKDKAKHWWDTYLGMLLFMPIYLLLMYFALNVLTTSPLFGSGSVANLVTTGVGNGSWYSGLMILGINAAIVIFLLNLPLITAISIAGSTMSFIKTDKLGAGAMWKKLGSQAGSRTLGRMAYSAGQSDRFARWASSSPLFGSVASAGLSKVSKAGFGGGKKGGYEERLKARKKSQEALHKQIGEVNRGDFATEEEFLAAKALRQSLQSDYRENLPWRNSKGQVGGILGFMFDNRANRQTQAKLDEAASKDAKKKAAKEAREQMKEADSKIKGIDDMLERLEEDEKVSTSEIEGLVKQIAESAKLNAARKELGLESTTAEAEQKLSETQMKSGGNSDFAKKLRADKKALKDLKGKLREKVDAGKEVEDQERDKKILDEIEGLKEKSSDSGSESKKP